MALKAILTKEEYGALADPIKAEYAEGDNESYVLQVEEVEGFGLTNETQNKQALQALHTEHEELKASLPEGATPETLKTELAELEDLRKGDPARQQEMTWLRTEKTRTDNLLLLSKALVKAGLSPEAAPLLIDRVRTKDDGTVEALDAMGKPMTKVVNGVAVAETVDDLIAGEKTGGGIIAKMTLDIKADDLKADDPKKTTQQQRQEIEEADPQKNPFGYRPGPSQEELDREVDSILEAVGESRLS